MPTELEAKLRRIGTQILTASRNELYLRMHFLDLALNALDYELDLSTPAFGTDGLLLHFNPKFLAERYRLNRAWINHAYLHSILHCLFRHLFHTAGREARQWSLSCDIAVESVIDSIAYKEIRLPPSWLRRSVYEKLGKELSVLTAEGIYHLLPELAPTEDALNQLEMEFVFDDHRFWPAPDENAPPSAAEQNWEDVSEKTQTNLETLAKDAGKESGDLLDQMQVENRERYDYRRFLRKFAVLKEEIQLDADSFDYAFYAYGLSLYGNMPLIEPQEFKEVQKIEDFVIAIDTSMSCSEQLIRVFLEETYSVLSESESFFKKINVHILQCDDKIQSDKRITDAAQLQAYMDQLELKGNGGTDFRPVFAYIETLTEQQAFHHLRGLLYFTDGCGTYPAKRPPYDTAFVFLQDDYTDTHVPPWAIKLILTREDAEDIRHFPMNRKELPAHEH